MSVEAYLRAFRDRWLIILLCLILGGAAGAGIHSLRPVEYTARTSLYVSAQVGSDPQQAYLGSQLSEQRMRSYTQLLTGTKVAKETAKRLKLEETPAQLARDINARVTSDSIVIDVEVTREDPEQAAQIANTVGAVFTNLVKTLERPATRSGTAPVAIRTVERADVPTGPSSTGLPMAVGIGLLAGLVIGLALALLRNIADSSIRTVEDLTEISGAPNLGAISHDGTIPSAPMLFERDRLNPIAESFRQIRTNLQFIDIDSPNKVLMVTSSMPSEGKSTTVANLAWALAATGSRVLLIDADLRRPEQARLLGVDRTIGLTRVLSGRMNLDQAIQPWGDDLFDILVSGPIPPNPSELLASDQMQQLLATVRHRYDVVLIDCSPLLPVTDAAALGPATDGAVLICRYKTTSRAQLSAAVDTLRKVSVEPLGTVFSMVPKRGPRAYGRYGSYYASTPESEHSGSVIGAEVPAPESVQGQPWTRRRDSAPRRGSRRANRR